MSDARDFSHIVRCFTVIPVSFLSGPKCPDGRGYASACHPVLVISPARRTAFQILRRVEEEHAFASDALAAASNRLAEKDAALAEEITFGVLRHQAQLDTLIGLFSGKRVERLDHEVTIALRMGIYQMRYLDRIPSYAAVGESVELVKVAGKRSAGSFVNAVLRKVNRDPVQWPTRAVRLSMPEWLLSAWDLEYGEENATRMAAAALRPPESFLRTGSTREGLQLEPAEIPGSFRVTGGSTRGVRLQDIGSQSVVPLLELEAGMRFLDLCAAPGNKTAQALESGVAAIACDLHLHRLRQVTGCERVVLDGAQGLPFRGQFDRVLVDAPCSGTGTLARNPEIKWRLQPQDLPNLHAKQVQILKNALTAVQPGGRLVYSTCSLERQENEDVIAEVAEDAGHRFHVRSMSHRLPGVQPGDGFFAAVIDIP